MTTVLSFRELCKFILAITTRRVSEVQLVPRSRFGLGFPRTNQNHAKLGSCRAFGTLWRFTNRNHGLASMANTCRHFVTESVQLQTWTQKPLITLISAISEMGYLRVSSVRTEVAGPVRNPEGAFNDDPNSNGSVLPNRIRNGSKSKTLTDPDASKSIKNA